MAIAIPPTTKKTNVRILNLSAIARTDPETIPIPKDSNHRPLILFWTLVKLHILMKDALTEINRFWICVVRAPRSSYNPHSKKSALLLKRIF